MVAAKASFTAPNAAKASFSAQRSAGGNTEKRLPPKASHPDADPEGHNMHGMSFTKVLGWWWAAWLVDLAVDQYITRVALEDPLDPLIGANVLSFIVSAIAGGLVIRLIMQISSWQETKLSQPQLATAY